MFHRTNNAGFDSEESLLQQSASDVSICVPTDASSGPTKAARANASHKTVVYLLYYFAFVLLAVPLIKTFGAEDIVANHLIRISDYYSGTGPVAPDTDTGIDEDSEYDADYYRAIEYLANKPSPAAVPSAGWDSIPSASLHEDAAISILHMITTKDWTAERSKNAQNFWAKAGQLSVVDATDLSDNIWNLFPDTGTCDLNFLKSVGGTPNNDGTYWVCTEFLQINNDCTIFSIGSRGMYEWELEMLTLTERKCKIHTFDCTGYWPSPDPLIEFHQWCLGNDYFEELSGKIYKSWSTIMTELNIINVDYLKIDIEGGEWIVMPQVLKAGNKLPRQISIEIHRGWQPTGTINNYALIKTVNGADNLHPTLNLISLFYSFGYENVIKKTWGPNFEIFTFVLYPTYGVNTSNLPATNAPLSLTSPIESSIPTLSSEELKGTFLTYDWNAARSREVQDFLQVVAKLPSVDASTLTSHVYDIFPETFECNRNFFRSAGGLPYDDGSYFICTEKLPFKDEKSNIVADDCTIVSLGSKGVWNWEQDIVAISQSKCKVVALDCTGDFKAPDESIIFHKWCAGNDTVVDGNSYKSWNTIVSELKLTRVDILKVDIEGWEWVLLPELLKQANALPTQIAIEFHTGFQPTGTGADFMPVETKNGPDHVRPMLNIMDLFHAAGYHVAAKKDWFVESEVYTFVLDTKVRDVAAKLPKTFVKREQDVVTHSYVGDIELLHQISTKNWNADRARSALKFWDVMENAKPEDLAMRRDRVHYMMPETYQCDRNFLRHIGGLPGDDGSYWVCTEFLQSPKCKQDDTAEGFFPCPEFFTPPEECNLLSIGSNGAFAWEEEMIKLTKGQCKLHTFDCTGTWTPPNKLITFHNWCLGNDEVIEGRTYKSWNTIVAELGLKSIDYMKMDIEGWEWVVIPQMFKGANVLPKQISIEIHEEWQPKGTNTEFMYTEFGDAVHRDHLHPVMNLFRLFYKTGYHMAVRKHFGWNCQVLTWVRPETRMGGIGSIPSNNVPAGPNPKPISAATAVELKRSIRTKNWNVERAKAAQDFWSLVVELPAAYAARVTNLQIFNLFPVTYECDKWWFLSIGGPPTTDGSHWACVDHINTTESSCTILSFGSNGVGEWEKELVEYTNGTCQAHRFDCSGDYVSPNQNIHLHKICLGESDKVVDGKEYMTWNSILDLLGVSRVDYLKIDVDGWEWVVMPEILSNDGVNKEKILPTQISIEFHVGWQPESTLPKYTSEVTVHGKDNLRPMVRMFQLFYSWGYQAVAKKMWSHPGGNCQIFTFVL
ncbi:UNVERIFIED_CONTAM: hypothetical protein HDU68_010701 [Siphonaria sp. JEL0065]|nr:hypothetical protein HDU68_010701 [Siphonaria sp. JEL0065]